MNVIKLFGLKSCTLIAIAILLGSTTLFSQIELPDPPMDGWTVGPNYLVWEAEATNSPLDRWEIVTPTDERYLDNEIVPPINETHLEFTGNNESVGPPTSPLEYTFTCPKTGKYRLGARLFQRLEGQPEDKCNDVYIRLEGDFTSANAVSTNDLKHDQKFYGRGVDKWGALFNLEVHSTGAHSSAIYNLKEGEEYTLTVSGRAQRTNIDYWILYETSIDYKLEAHVDIAVENSEEFRPPSTTCKTINAIDMKYTGIDGFTDAQTDNKAGLDILQIADRLAWAAAQYVFEGTNGDAMFTLNTMQETDGESSYRVRINGELIKEVTNDRIYGTGIPDYTIQNHVITDTAIPLNDGDTIQIEFSNATNGLVPEGNETATSRGRWVSLDICTSGRFTNYHVNLEKESLSILPEDTVTLKTEVVLPRDADTTLIWKSNNPEIATVDSTGMVIAKIEGKTRIIVSSFDGEYKDSCDLTVIIPEPFSGELIPIPGYIEAEDYDIGGEGATYHDSDGNNEGGQYRPNDGVDIEACSEGGYNIGWTHAGEWLMYSINVEETGNYYFETRVAAMDKEIQYHIEIDGEDVTGVQTANATGGWQNWKNVKTENIDLEAGKHLVTLVLESAGWNINWIRMFVTGSTIDATGVKLKESTIITKESTSKTLTATVLPDNATNQGVNWTSLSDEIATVDENGKVTGVSVGSTAIIVETKDGAFSAMCSVEVIANPTSVKEKSETLAVVYPNPFKNEFTVRQSDEFPIEKVIVRNILGQKVLEQNLLGEKETKLNLDSNKGLYFLEILSKNKVQTISILSE